MQLLSKAKFMHRANIITCPDTPVQSHLVTCGDTAKGQKDYKLC